MCPAPVVSPEENTPLELDLAVAEGYGSVLKNRNFLVLWLGQIFSQVADRIVFVVFISMIVHNFGPSDRYSSFLYIAFTVPAIVLTAVAGVFVDRWPRRAVLVTTNIIRAVLVGFLVVAADAGLWHIYLLAFMLSAATQFFVPAEAATIPMLVRKSQLMSANSLFTTTMMASVIFGFALGDPLINIFSLSHVNWAIVALFAMAAVTLMYVKVPATCRLGANTVEPQDEHSALEVIRESEKEFFAEMREGIHYIWENRVILHAMLKLALLFSSLVALCILSIGFARDYLYTNPVVAARKFAYIITYSGIGMALGALLVGNVFRNARRGFMVYGGFVGMGAALMMLAWIDPLIPATAVLWTTPEVKLPWVYLDPIHLSFRMIYTYTFSALTGMAAAFSAIPLQAFLHELIPEDKRGKILGIQFTILSTSSTLPVLVAGLGVEQLGVQFMFLLIGGPLLLLGLIGLYLRLKQNHAASANW
jgi:MFS family permease